MLARGNALMTRSTVACWTTLERHFDQHVRQVEYFRQAGPDAVARMWQTQTNERGKCLTQFERDALIERHCELFGIWPSAQYSVSEEVVQA